MQEQTLVRAEVITRHKSAQGGKGEGGDSNTSLVCLFTDPDLKVDDLCVHHCCSAISLTPACYIWPVCTQEVYATGFQSSF